MNRLRIGAVLVLDAADTVAAPVATEVAAPAAHTPVAAVSLKPSTALDSGAPGTTGSGVGGIVEELVV